MTSNHLAMNPEMTRRKFDYAVSMSNRSKLTPEVVQRLALHESEKIFRSGMQEKVVRAIANVLVETAHQDVIITEKLGRVHDSLSLKRKFYADEQIKEICGLNGLFFAKHTVYALNEMFEKFGDDLERVKEILNYIKIRRNEEIVYDIYSLHKIANDAAFSIKHSPSPAIRKIIVENMLLDTKEIEEDLKLLQEDWNKEMIRLARVDPQYVETTIRY